MTVPHVILSGIVGSQAYGLAGPDSDVDRLGIFATPTEELHGLNRPAESIVTTAPDLVLHEARKYAALALNGNPSVTELLWLNDYEVRTPHGDQLINIRQAFLSGPRARSAYLEYARGQFHRLEARGDGSFSSDTRKRTRKHAIHTARLLHQGLELYRTGRLTVRLDDPARFHDFGDRVATGDLDAGRKLLAQAEADFDATRSPLPARPDTATVEAWLRTVRRELWIEANNAH